MTSTSDGESDFAKAEDLLRLAAQTSNMAERGRLIDEASWWRFRATSAESGDSLIDLTDAAMDLDAPAVEQAVRPARP